MPTTFEINPFDPNEMAQKTFQRAMDLLVRNYSKPTCFSKTLTFPNHSETFTLSYEGVITTKRKDGKKSENQKPRYVAFYNQKIGEGSFGKVFVVSVIYKYPALDDCQGLKTLQPLKIKHPNLLMKVTKFQSENFNFHVQEQTYGQNFIKMSYVACATNYNFMLLMEQVPGIPLSKFIALLNKNPAMISAKSYLQIARNLLQALLNIHLKNLIHCDITPNNIMIDENFNVRFIDFGLSRKTNNYNANLCGTPLYHPSEYCKTNTQKLDIFSLCLVILQLLGDTHRNYLRTDQELESDNYKIGVNEILLGTNDFSFEEIKSVKAILMAALDNKRGKRLDDLPTLINKFDTLLKNHTRAQVVPCILFDNTKLQDIIAYQQKGVPILLADIIEWFSRKKRLSIDTQTWCSIALYLYHQLKEEADAYFLTANINDPFIQTFIAYQLPRHAKWQDTAIAEYCYNITSINHERQIIMRLIDNETLKSSPFARQLATIIHQDNDHNFFLNQAKIAKQAIDLVTTLTYICDAIDNQKIRDLITLKQKRLIDGTLSIPNEVTNKLYGYKQVQTSLKAIVCVTTHQHATSRGLSAGSSEHLCIMDPADKPRGVETRVVPRQLLVCLKERNPTCYQTLSLAIESGLKNFINGQCSDYDLDDNVEKILQNLETINKCLIILNNLKKKYHISDDIYNHFLSLFNNILTNLNLNNHATLINTVQPTIRQLDSLSTSIENIRRLSKQWTKAPGVIDWANIQLLLVFTNDRNITDFNNTVNQIKLYAQNLSIYLSTSYEKKVDILAWKLLFQLTQSIFQLPSLEQINKSLVALIKERYRLHEDTVTLIRLKKTLFYAGYWDRVQTIFEQALIKYLDNPNTNTFKLNQAIVIADSIVELLNYHDTFSSPPNLCVFNAIVEYLFNHDGKMDISRYCELQNKIAQVMITTPSTSCSVLDSVVKSCATGNLEQAIKRLRNVNSTPVSTLTIFTTAYNTDGLEYSAPVYE